jgi:hypothetical protein
MAGGRRISRPACRWRPQVPHQSTRSTIHPRRTPQADRPGRSGRGALLVAVDGTLDQGWPILAHRAAPRPSPQIHRLRGHLLGYPIAVPHHRKCGKSSLDFIFCFVTFTLRASFSFSWIETRAAFTTPSLRLSGTFCAATRGLAPRSWCRAVCGSWRQRMIDVLIHLAVSIDMGRIGVENLHPWK